MITNENSINKGIKTKNLLIDMLVFGSIWGLLDLLTVTYLVPPCHIQKLCSCAITVVIIGFPLMTMILIKYRKPLMLIGMGIIAALFKLLDFAIITLPFINGHTIYQPVVNPAIAAVTVSITFAVFAGILINRLETNFLLRIITGFVAGFCSVIAFVLTTFYITQTHPFIVDTPMQLLFPLHGPLAAITGSIMLPLGFLLAKYLNEKTFALQTKKPIIYYFSSVLIVAFCVITCALMLVSNT